MERGEGLEGLLRGGFLGGVFKFIFASYLSDIQIFTKKKGQKGVLFFKTSFRVYV